jgi:hypothetical protein
MRRDEFRDTEKRGQRNEVRTSRGKRQRGTTVVTSRLGIIQALLANNVDQN